MLALLLLFADGTITGVIDKPAGVTAVTAIDRTAETDVKHKGAFDAKTGKFTFAKLPLGKKYCLLIEAGNVRLEGVDLNVPPSDFEEEMPLTKEDVKEIEKIAKALNKFENEINILSVRGNCQHAAVVLDKRRTTPFYESKPGEMIWRLEVWRFEKPEESWLKSTTELGQVMYRERLMKEAFAKKAHTLDAKLGGIALTKEKPSVDVGKVVMPDGKAGIHLRN
jgi:hypothetical protein